MSCVFVVDWNFSNDNLFNYKNLKLVLIFIKGTYSTHALVVQRDRLFSRFFSLIDSRVK